MATKAIEVDMATLRRLATRPLFMFDYGITAALELAHGWRLYLRKSLLPFDVTWDGRLVQQQALPQDRR